MIRNAQKGPLCHLRTTHSRHLRIRLVLPCPLISLRKHAYSNILKIFPPKNDNFQIRISDIFHISTQNIDCGYSLEPPRKGGSNEYPQSMFLSRNKKNNVYPCKPQFYYIKVGFIRVKTILACFRDGSMDTVVYVDKQRMHNPDCKDADADAFAVRIWHI